jgi:hypothetical protein
MGKPKEDLQREAKDIYSRSSDLDKVHLSCRLHLRQARPKATRKRLRRQLQSPLQSPKWTPRLQSQEGESSYSAAAVCHQRWIEVSGGVSVVYHDEERTTACDIVMGDDNDEVEEEYRPVGLVAAPL